MSGKTRILILLVLTVSVLGGTMLKSFAQPDSSVEMLGFLITFQGVEYDAAANESKWMYKVEGREDAPHDLSHWDLGLCGPGHVLAVQNGKRYKTSHPNRTEVGTNPHTDIDGIKFEVEVDKWETAEFWFVLHGNWEIGEVEVGAKAGLPVEVGKILGPSCEPVICEVQYSVEHGRTDFRVLRPGTYASIFSVIHLAGTGNVKLSFDEFEHAIYLADPLAPPIELQFGIGATLAEVDASGWLTAAELNDYVLQISAAEIEGGEEFIVWVRLHVEEFHFSSDYEVSGKIYIAVDCPL